MLFNSLQFLFFFVIVTSLYYLLPHRFRWQLLLFSSCYFYMAFVPIYILILGFTIIIDYYSGIYIEKSKGKLRRLYLIVSLIANISVLGIFKYYNFLNSFLNNLLCGFNFSTPFPYLNILLPIGLSFHTFQAMSYTIEVFRDNQKAEKHFGIYALYVMFYPQLVAGPIERPQNILSQFYTEHYFKIENLSKGLKLIAWGLFKKVVIADRLGVIVDNVYNNPSKFYGLPLIFATVLFAFQIYCDFSGYSDIALGSARSMGFKLMKNFNSPYFSTSISEFWKRWHISLSTWFRDYLYIPLGGNRVPTFKWYFNIFFTFLISGLWHGANWTYLIWGGLNGLYLIFENIILKLQLTFYISFNIKKNQKIYSVLSFFVTFSLICFAWIFFRANSVNDALYISSHLFSNISSSFYELKPGVLGSSQYDYIILVLSLILLFLVESSQIFISTYLQRQSVFVRILLYYAFALFILLFGMFDVQEQFIYFQF